MKIVVAIKQVLDPSGIGVNPRSGRITVNREEYLMDPAAKNALEAALRLKDTAGAEVIALTLGPERASDALCEALGMGADRAIHLLDAAFDQTDAAGVARALARAVERIAAVDLALLGDRSLDSGEGQVGARLAAALDWPLLSQAQQASLPAVVTVAEWSYPPRYAHAGRLLQAYEEGNVERWNAADLGLDEGALRPMVEVRGQVAPPERQLGFILSGLNGAPEDAAAQLAEHLYIRLGLGG